MIARKSSQTRGRRPKRQPNGRPRGGRRSRSMLIEKTRLSNPSVPIHKYSRTTNQALSLTPSTGWNATAFDLEIAFALNATNFYIGGVLVSAASNPGSADFTALYDEYRLDSVEVSFMYGANMVAAGPTTSPQLPILNIVFDPTDVSVISLSSILQYQDLHTVQLGNQRTANGYVVKCTPRPLLTAGGSATAAAMENPWMNIDVVTTPYYGLKVFYDAAASTAATVIGTVNIYVKYHWSFRLSK